MPDTALANAFLIALAKWAEHHADSDTIVLPIGTVTGRELLPVLRPLGFGNHHAAKENAP